MTLADYLRDYARTWNECATEYRMFMILMLPVHLGGFAFKYWASYCLLFPPGGVALCIILRVLFPEVFNQGH